MVELSPDCQGRKETLDVLQAGVYVPQVPAGFLRQGCTWSNLGYNIWWKWLQGRFVIRFDTFPLLGFS